MENIDINESTHCPQFSVVCGQFFVDGNRRKLTFNHSLNADWGFQCFFILFLIICPSYDIVSCSSGIDSYYTCSIHLVIVHFVIFIFYALYAEYKIN